MIGSAHVPRAVPGVAPDIFLSADSADFRRRKNGNNLRESAKSADAASNPIASTPPAPINIP
jgi:hypothetical protein